MTAPELSAEEAAVVQRFEDTPYAPEALRERIAEAMYVHLGESEIRPWTEAHPADQAECRGIADVALAVLRGES